MEPNSPKKFSWKTATVLFFGVGLATAGLSIFFQTHGGISEYLVKADPKPLAMANAAMSVGSSFAAPGKPLKLLIPSIGVDASIQSIGLSWTGNGDMGIPTNFTDVAWYNGGPIPGMPGNAVIDGHLDGRNVPKAVFYNLGNLKAGDIVEVIETAGMVSEFQVTKVISYDYNASTTDIFSQNTSGTHLNLITCAGDWIPSIKLYNKRVVVFTDLVQTN